MSRRTLDLTALDWQFGQAPRQPFSPTPLDDRAAVREWLPAKVPGDVRADLLAAGRIPALESPEGIIAGAWADDVDWWYRVTLPEGLAPEEPAVLEADGIDYYSAVWLDDLLLATHAGMFARQAVALSPHVNRLGSHELAIRVWGAGALPRLPNPPGRRLARWLIGRSGSGAEYFPDRMATPKAQFSFGWDFSPRLLSSGIWDDLRLVIAREVYIEDLWVRAEPLTERDDPTPVRWRLRLRVFRRKPGPLRVEVSIGPRDERGGLDEPALRLKLDLAAPSARLEGTMSSVTGRLQEATEEYEIGAEAAAARRWWPWDQGAPALYRVTVKLSDERGEMDEISRVAGVRTVERRTLPGGAPWSFVFNGRPVFLRGGNWVPADILPGRVTPEDYARLLGQAREAGINFLRVWGGGVREKRAFWETCDRLGIAVWQEFPLACAFLDHYPRDRAYLEALAAEARGVARTLRNHPSLMAWCGGNEINPARESLPLAAIRRVLEQEDPGRPWIPASPSEGDVHQWRVWHGRAPWTDLARGRAPFMSEYGLQALPDAATVAEMFPGDVPTSLDDGRWGQRKAQVAKLRHYGGPDMAGGVAAAIAASQRVQATALQVGLEACRLRRVQGQRDRVFETNATPYESAACGGVAFWQFNEPWPAVSWSVVDKAGRPKAAMEMLRHCYQPVLIAARFSWRRYEPGNRFRADIWLVNDGPERWPDCQASAALDDRPVWTVGGLSVEPASAHRAGGFTCSLTASPRTLSLRVVCGSAVLATNLYDLAVPLPRGRSWRGRLMQWLADRLLGPD